MHHHIAGKGHRQVIAEAFLCRLRGLGTTVLNTEQQLVAFLTVFAHQRLQGFLRRGLNLLETIELIDGADGVEDIVALGHLNGTKVARSLWNTWFLCHYFLTMVCARSGPMLIILMGVSSFFSRKAI